MKKVGMRTIKTGIGVVISSILGFIATGNSLNPSIACIISVQDSVSGSLEVGKNRMYGTVLGGIIGYLFIFYYPGNSLLSGLGVILTIYLCNLLNLNSGASIAAITFLSVQIGFTVSEDALSYSINKVFENAIGVVVGIATNYLLARPNHSISIYSNFKQVENNINKFLKFKLLESKSKFEPEFLEDKISEIEEVHKKLLKEADYSRQDADLVKIEEGINTCKTLYSHIQSIELLSKKVYLNNENYEVVKKLYKKDKIKLSQDEENSPVFNYHLKEIIKEMEKLREILKDSIK